MGSTSASAPPPEGQGTVVLLHGLGRRAASMGRLARALRQAGWHTCNIGYPSRRHSIEVLASEHLLPRLRACARPQQPLHFVTHSMGGILVRQLRVADPSLPIGRVVMLGPPNHGSELVDHLRARRWFRWLNGPAGQQLGTDARSLPNRLGPAGFELGVIAGNRPWLEPFGHWIAGAGDGKVSVASARLPGMQDFRVLPLTHAFMMRDSVAIGHTLAFLRTGRFLPGPER